MTTEEERKEEEENRRGREEKRRGEEGREEKTTEEKRRGEDCTGEKRGEENDEETREANRIASLPICLLAYLLACLPIFHSVILSYPFACLLLCSRTLPGPVFV